VSGEVELHLPPDARYVGIARLLMTVAARQAGMDDERVEDLKIAVSEAVTNAILHAFRDRDPGDVLVSGRVDRGRLIIAVGDNGTGMRPNLESTGLGLGISLITKLASDVRFDSTERGTTVSMSFALDAGGGTG
jgi:anti-sigma regulatory factor (Ser/Thr protein kinase)